MLQKRLTSSRMRFLLGDVRDRERLEMALAGASLVYHLAAIKHVDIAAYNPTEALATNIDGTINVIRCCLKTKPYHMFFTSTDKAVNPISLYGYSKAIGERLTLWANQISDHTRYTVLRFGNVKQSSGNVFEVWENQLNNKQPLTVTDMNATRFFIELEEAINFIIEATNYASGGEIYVSEMKEYNIGKLARSLSDNIDVVGLRLDEKLHEELLTVREKVHAKKFGEKCWVIIVFFSNRAEIGLLEPVMKRIEKSDKLDLVKADLFEGLGQEIDSKLLEASIDEYGLLYNYCHRFLQKEKPALVLCCFDRLEMIFPTLAAFYQNIPIAQMHAGDLSLEGSLDDVTRHAISFYATIHFCNGEKSYNRIVEVLKRLGRSTENVYEVGSTAFDDVEIDEDVCPTKPYDLVIYLSPTRRPDLIGKEITQILKMLDKFTAWVQPSGRDPGDEKIIEALQDHHTVLASPHPYLVYKTLPRPMYLGLMKNCSRIIGNSSSLFFEAPYFLKQDQIIHVGVRNKGREFVEIRPGASDRIVEVLEKYLDGSQ